jgi:lysozyme
MILDKKGIDLIQLNEGLSLKAYLDTGGVWTIGWGNTSINGKPVTKGMTCTREEADEEFLKDTQDSQKAVNRLVKVPLTQGQYNALVDFVFNLGVDQFSKSTILKLLNNRDYDGACSQFMRWIYDNGKVVDGLKLRRQRAQEMFKS